MNPHTASRLLTAALFLCVSSAWAGSDFEDLGRRDNLVLIPDGRILVVNTPAEDVSGVAIESPGGAQAVVAAPGECLGDCGSGDPLNLQGVGSNPDMNNNGVVTFKGSFLHCTEVDVETPKGAQCPEAKGTTTDRRATAHGIFTGTPASLTTIAIARENENGDPIDGDTFCDFEPMPRINENGQVFFGAHTDIAGGFLMVLTRVGLNEDWESDPAGGNQCGGRRFRTDVGEQRKGIYRWSAPSTIDTLLETQADSNLTTITVSPDTEFVNSTTTFAITDTHLNTQGADLANNSGHVVAYAMFDADPFDDDDGCLFGKGGSQSECTSESAYFLDDRMGLLYLRGEGSRSLIAMAGPPGESIFQEVQEGAVNESGQVVFKTQTGVQRTDEKGNCNSGNCIPEPQICGIGEDFDDGCEDDPELGSQLNIWSNNPAKGGPLNTFVKSGDPVPGGSTANFAGFTKHADINNSGNVAFIGSIDLGGACDEQDPIQKGAGGRFRADQCKGVYFYSGGFIQEVARTTIANQLDPGGGQTDSFEGFRFDSIGAVAVINNENKVFFTAENVDSDPFCGSPVEGDNGEGFGSGELTGIYGWTPDMGMAKVIKEGDVIPEGRVIRLFTPQPELRQHANDDGTFVIRLWVDNTNGCRPNEEVILSVEMIAPSVIPALAPWALLLLAGLFGLGGVAVLRRRT